MLLAQTFENHPITHVVHLAGLKSVSDSVAHPLEYFDVNVTGTIALCNAMKNAGVFNLIFSSSATVYGTATAPITEEINPRPTNPYGYTKLMCEHILKSLCDSDSRWSITSFRFFNPIGAHLSGELREEPIGAPNNLVPYMLDVGNGSRDVLQIFGNDYDTEDGTGVRDYVHVQDVANAIHKAIAEAPRGYDVYNLGLGKGNSVLDVIRTYETACNKHVPYVFASRRAGDVGELWCDPSKAERILGWKATRTLSDMLQDAQFARDVIS